MGWDLEEKEAEVPAIQETIPTIPMTLDQVKAAIERGRASLQVYSQAIKDMKVEAQLLKVDSEETHALSVDLGIRAKKVAKEINETIKKSLAPADSYMKAIKNFGKEFTETLDQIEAITKSKNRDFKVLQEQREMEAAKKREEETKRIQEIVNQEAEKAGIEPLKVEAPPAQKAPRVVRTESGVAYSSEYWRFEAGPVHRNDPIYEGVGRPRMILYGKTETISIFERAEKMGMVGEALENLKSQLTALNEVKIEIELDDKGNIAIVAVNGKLFPIIPTEFLEADSKALRKAVDGGMRNIDGVRIWREDKEIYK